LSKKIFLIFLSLCLLCVPTVFAQSQNSLSALNGKTIVIDPGHGGSDSGAVGPSGILEKNVTLAVALKVKAILNDTGAVVILTRSSDRDVSDIKNAADAQELQARADVGNKNRADVFLSIHANSFSSQAAHGTAAYYSTGSSMGAVFAADLQDELVRAGGLADRGTSAADFYVLKHTNMPASLVEMAFISNSQEEQLLNSDGFQQKMAEAICRALNRFFS
jgi:N-acetylmuramoyl-L-alanine amidase